MTTLCPICKQIKKECEPPFFGLCETCRADQFKRQRKHEKCCTSRRRTIHEDSFDDQNEKWRTRDRNEHENRTESEPDLSHSEN